MTSSLINVNPVRPTAGSYRWHLLSLRCAIEFGWPRKGFLGRGGLPGDAEERIYMILRALPFPLPLESGGKPSIFFRSDSKDLRVATGAVVDAAFALLADEDLERVYEGPVQLLKKHEDGRLVLTTWRSPKVIELLTSLNEGLEAIAQVLA